MLTGLTVVGALAMRLVGLLFSPLWLGPAAAGPFLLGFARGGGIVPPAA